MKRFVGIAIFVLSGALAFVRYAPLQVLEDEPVVVGFAQEELLAELERAEKEILELWLENQRRNAQHRLIALHQTLMPTLEFLRHEHHSQALMAEHQIGWVLHRLRYAPSKSQKREHAYVETLSEHLRDCISLLPPEPTLDVPVEESFEPQVSEMSTSNTVLLRPRQ
ncbi:MAG: hypothetical protein VX278_21950 [Myxococcota bacterium]|nr:hypothetical protein [Myxococcota bacterium]